MKIAIYGGTFDPPHLGHIGVARSVVDNGLADCTWLLVSPRNPLKKNMIISPEEDRLAMAVLSAKGVDGIYVSDFEFELPRPSYSIDTLRKLKEAYPEHEFRMLIGADNLEAFSRWKEPESILSEFGVIVYPRPGSIVEENEESLSFGNLENIKIIGDAKRYDVSSTEIRRMVKNGEDISGLVNPGVEKYIRDHKLYRK